MKRHLTLLATTVILMTTISLWGQENAPAPEPKPEPEDHRLTVVLDSERPSKTDILLLRNGDKLTGTILNKTFSIRTSYASLSFNNRMIAGIDLEGGANNIEAIITVNNNRFSGFIDDPVFVFKLQAGAQIEIRREKVLKAIFRVRDAERQGIPQRQFAVLKNGDYFSGKLLTEQISIKTTYATVPVALSDADSITLIGAKTPLTKVRMKNEDTVQGVLETEDIKIELDVGPSVTIYKDRLDVIYTTEGFIPERIGARRSSDTFVHLDFESENPLKDETQRLVFSPDWRTWKSGGDHKMYPSKSGDRVALSHELHPAMTFRSPVRQVRFYGTTSGETKTVVALDATGGFLCEATFKGKHKFVNLEASMPVIKSVFIRGKSSNWVIDDVLFR